MWCIAHIIHNSLVEAFGISIDKKKGKNQPARDLIALVRKLIERVNKSPNNKVGYGEIVTSCIGGRSSLLVRPNVR